MNKNNYKGVKTVMGIKADKQRLVTLAVALVLAAAIILSSVFTVAAASQTTETNAPTTEASKEINTKSECELPNGDLIITRNRNFEITIDVFKMGRQYIPV